MAEASSMRRCGRQSGIVLAVVLGTLVQMATAQSLTHIGIVVMHGKGGAPTKHVSELVASLETQGALVANLEMPWSAARAYDMDVAGAERQVESALTDLHSKGAAHLFVVGHSQGGLFALYFGGRHALDGIVAIAPGGNVASPEMREQLADSVARAHRLVDGGQGATTTRFLDFERSKGSFGVFATPANYLSWFDPDGAMNEANAARNVRPGTPVLFIAPTGDYPGLRQVKQAMFGALPRDPLTRLYEPSASHVSAPAASRDAIARWISEVVTGADATAKAPPP